jgi:hypothetical protein
MARGGCDEMSKNKSKNKNKRRSLFTVGVSQSVS